MNWPLSLTFPFIKAFSNLPATLPNKQNPSGTGLEDRTIPSDPLADWFLGLASKIPPKEVEMILRQAQGGNLWQYTQLIQKMRDTWPCFAKASFELRSAIAGANFAVVPFEDPGKEVTKTAQDKADFIRRCLASFRPKRFKDEDGFKGMIFDLTDAILIGVSITELIWDENFIAPDGSKEKNIRASAWVHPRHYSFQGDGTVGIAPTEQSQWLQFPVQQSSLENLTDGEDAEHKFLVAKFKSKSGTALSAGFGRTLAYYWTTVVYGRDFMLNFAQKYGNPFLDIPYQSGIPETEIVKFQAIAKKAASQGYMVHPNTAEIKVTPAQGMGNENPSVVLARMADEACQMLLLGQTLTSSAPINGGTRAQGDVHADVRSERIEGLVKWVAEILTEQLVESLLIQNYGESSERPTIQPDMTTPLDALEQAQFLTALSTCTVPLPVADTYKKLGIPAPSTGDHVLVAGKMGVLGDVTTEIEANPAPPDPYGAFGQPGGGEEYGQEDSSNDPNADPAADDSGGESEAGGTGEGDEETAYASRQRRPGRNVVMAGAPFGNRNAAKDYVKSPAFKAWFAGSKVVNKDGSPMVVYHGTSYLPNKGISVFKPNSHFGTRSAANARVKDDNPNDERTVKYQLEHPENEPAEFNTSIYPVYLSIKNPMRAVDDPDGDKGDREGADGWARDIAKAKRLGYDGIVYKNLDEGGTSWIAFRPDQIKSAITNSGKFKGKDITAFQPPDIRKILVKASPAQVAQLQMLVAKAKNARHLNGEVGEIRAKIFEIQQSIK